MSELAFPELADEVVDAAPTKPEQPGGIAVIRQAALSELSAVERGIAALTAEHGSTDYDITKPLGYKMATARRQAVRLVRYQVPKTLTAIKAELRAIGGDAEDQAERIVKALRAIEDPHDEKIKAEDERREAVKAEAARIEAERVQKHQARIDIIRSYLGHAQQPGMTAERIAGGMTVLAAQTFPKSEWEEFDVQAANAQCETLEAMRVLHAQVLGREQEAARQEAIRLENERQAEINRLERERIAAELAEIRRATEALEAQQAAARKAAEDKARAEAEEKAQAEAAAAEEQRIAEATEAARKKALEVPAAVLVTYDADTNKFAASAFQPDTEITEGQAPRQVLKAEPATADATDREAPATTSPRVGAMGAEQAADAAPVEPTRVLAALTCEGRGIYLTGYLPEAKFDEIKAIFLNATQGAK